MNKNKVGKFLGVVSIMTIIINLIIFFIQRGPDADTYFFITVFGILSIIGVVSAILSFWFSRNLIIFIIGLLGNSAILIFIYFLLLAMGISEP